MSDKAKPSDDMPDFVKRQYEGMVREFLGRLKERKTSGDLLDVSVTGDWHDRHMDNVDYRVVKALMWAYMTGLAEARLDDDPGYRFLNEWLEELRAEAEGETPKL